MQKAEAPQEPWKPDPGKYADAWKRVWYDIVEGRKFSIATTHGTSIAERYRYHTAERDYFLQWGKLPHHVIEDECEQCDMGQARQVASWVDAHHRRFFNEVMDEAMPHITKFRQRLERNRKRSRGMAAYAADNEDREKLIQLSAEILERFRADERAKRANLDGDAKKKGHQGEQAAQQGAQEAHREEANPDATEE